MWANTGLFTMGTIGLGRPTVKGRSLEPEPPAITTAFMNTCLVGVLCVSMDAVLSHRRRYAIILYHKEGVQQTISCKALFFLLQLQGASAPTDIALPDIERHGRCYDDWLKLSSRLGALRWWREGAYHVGVLRFLEEHEWEPDVIVGTSIGAVNGAAIASGHSAVDAAPDLKHRDIPSPFPQHKQAAL
jgi:hypothetical protein